MPKSHEKQPGILPDEAVREIYSREGCLDGWEKDAVKRMLQVVRAGTWKCLAIGQKDALEAGLPGDLEDIRAIGKKVGSDAAADVFAIRKGVAIRSLATLECEDCTQADECPESDRK